MSPEVQKNADGFRAAYAALKAPVDALAAAPLRDKGTGQGHPRRKAVREGMKALRHAMQAMMNAARAEVGQPPETEPPV